MDSKSLSSLVRKKLKIKRNQEFERGKARLNFKLYLTLKNQIAVINSLYIYFMSQNRLYEQKFN